MKQMQKSTFSLLFIIKKSKLRKNGEAPICLRITVNGRIEEVMVKRTVPVATWNQAKECSNGKDHVARELNHYLSTVKARIYQMRRELEIDGVPVTAQGDNLHPLPFTSAVSVNLFSHTAEQVRSATRLPIPLSA